VKREALPTGWTLVTDQGGMLRIRPHDRAHHALGLLLVAAGLGCCGFAGMLFAILSRGAGGWRGLRLTMLLPLGVLLIGQGLWLTFGREEWRVSADLLEVRRHLLGVRWARRFQGAALRLIGMTGGSASRAQRRLLAAARGWTHAARGAERGRIVHQRPEGNATSRRLLARLRSS
jgi:hypothetical protein